MKTTIVRAKEQDPFREVNSDTTVVDVYGKLTVRVAQELCQRAPSLNTIFLAPWAFREAENHGLSALRICRERGIKIRVRPWKNPWETRQPMPPSSFEASRNFLLNLSGEKKDRFEELILLHFPEALATARYYCLKEEPYLSLQRVAKLHGFNSASRTQDKIRAVLLYVDEQSMPSFSQKARQLARSIERKIMRSRAKGVNNQELLGSPFVRTPAGMPLTPLCLREFKLVLARSLDGSLARLQRKSPQDHRALVLRFGLEDGRYRTLEEVGKEMGGVTRERARQRESQAFKFLRISSPPKRRGNRRASSKRAS